MIFRAVSISLRGACAIKSNRDFVVPDTMIADTISRFGVAAL